MASSVSRTSSSIACRLLLRATVALVATGGLAFGALGLSSLASWHNGALASSFSADLPEREAANSVLNGEYDSKRERSSVIALAVSDHIAIDATIVVDANDPLARDVGQGQFRSDPGSLLSQAMYLNFSDRNDSFTRIAWAPPTVEVLSGSGEVKLHLSGQSDATDAILAPLTIHILFVDTDDVVLRVSTPGDDDNPWLVASVEPSGSVISQSDTAVTMSAPAQSGEGSVVLDHPLASRSITQLGSLDLPWQLDQAKLVLFALGPLALLVGWGAAYGRKREALARWNPSQWSASGWLILGAGAAILSSLLPLIDEALSSSGQMYIIRNSFPDASGSFLFPTVVPAGLAIALAWIGSAASRTLGRHHPDGRTRFTTAGLVSTLIALAVIVLALVFAPAGAQHDGGAQQAAIAIFAAMLVASSVLVVSAFGGRQPLAIGTLAALPAVIVCIGAGTTASAAATWICVWILSLTAAAVLAGMTFIAVTSARSEWSSSLPKWGVFFGLLACAIFAMWPRDPSLTSVNGSFFWAWMIPQSFESEIGILAVVLVMAGLAAPNVPARWIRLAAAACLAFLLFRPESTYLGIPLSWIVGALLTFGFLLRRLPADDLAYALHSGNDAFGATGELLRKLGVSRLHREYSATLRKKLLGGNGSAEESAETKALLESEISAGSGAPTKAERELGLNSGGIGSPWARATFGALLATLVGLPLSVPFVLQALTTVDNANGFNWFNDVLDAFLGFRFPFYGAAFGFFYPLIRGTGGLGKSVRLLVVLAVTEAIVILFPFINSPETTGVLSLRGLQLVVMCITLGVGFDLRTLRAVGLGLDRIGDLYNVNRLTVWFSGIAVTAAAALLTALLSSATTALIERISVPPPADGSTSQSQEH